MAQRAGLTQKKVLSDIPDRGAEYGVYYGLGCHGYLYAVYDKGCRNQRDRFKYGTRRRVGLNGDLYCSIQRENP